ncbi:MAG: site-2 protease family protein, partial [Dehalococcoidia bacterium]|nr:site-2 protease family protein [Dehalococcoidia bacterium]
MDGVLDFLFRAVTFLGVLFVLVFVHELGHFATAKWAGVRVLEFGIGFPPRAWAFRRGETEYSLNWLPLGGFVRMVGEEDPSDPRSLAAASIPWRLVILSAGVIMNVALAFVLLTVSGMLPKQELRGEMFIANVRDGSPAQLVGIQPNDVVVAVNGRPIRNFQDLNYNIRLNLGTP